MKLTSLAPFISLPRTHNLSKVLYVTSSGTKPFFRIKTTTSIACKFKGDCVKMIVLRWKGEESDRYKDEDRHGKWCKRR